MAAAQATRPASVQGAVTDTSMGWLESDVKAMLIATVL
jgi:hypothetical protein